MGRVRWEVGVLESTIRFLTVLFWVASIAFVMLTVLSGWNASLAESLVGERGFLFARVGSLCFACLCSGLLLRHEWSKTPVDQSEYGEWTGMGIFYAIVFAISFFVGCFYLAAVYFGS